MYIPQNLHSYQRYLNISPFIELNALRKQFFCLKRHILWSYFVSSFGIGNQRLIPSYTFILCAKALPVTRNKMDTVPGPTMQGSCLFSRILVRGLTGEHLQVRNVAEEIEVKVMISPCLSQGARVCIATAYMGQLPRLGAGWKRVDRNLEGKQRLSNTSDYAVDLCSLTKSFGPFWHPFL